MYLYVYIYTCATRVCGVAVRDAASDAARRRDVERQGILIGLVLLQSGLGHGATFSSFEKNVTDSAREAPDPPRPRRPSGLVSSFR